MRVLFMGRKQVGADCLAWLCSEGHAVQAVLTDHHLAESPTEAVARENGIPVITLEDAKEAISASTLEFDLGVSVVYWRRIPSTLIAAASRGIINFHPAPLPDYKGTAGYNLAILNGLNQWATSAHYVDNTIDTGPIIEVDYFDIDPDRETAQTVEAKSVARMAEQFKRVIRQASQSSGLMETHTNEGGVYITRRQMEEMKVVRPGDDIDRKIRAFWFPPYSGATVIVEGKAYTLVNSSILESLAAESGAATSLFSRPASPGQSQ